MPRTIDTRYNFNFVGVDESPYSRQVYWEALYSLSANGHQFLLTDRTAPHSTLPYALYLTAKGKKRLEQRGTTSSNKNVALVQQITDLVEVPSEEDALMRGGSGESLARYEGSSETDIGALAGVTKRDQKLVQAGYLVHRALQQQHDMAVRGSENALARTNDGGMSFWDKAYGNRKYLQFVMQVLQAKGSYLVGTSVPHFLSYCLTKFAQQADLDPVFWKEELESMLGEAEASASGFLPYHNVTILGFLQVGSLRRNNVDPESTGRSFQVDPNTDLSEIVLRELKGGCIRSVVRKIARWTLHQNIKLPNGLVFVDEIEVE